jgi:hypothetical protein
MIGPRSTKPHRSVVIKTGYQLTSTRAQKFLACHLPAALRTAIGKATTDRPVSRSSFENSATALLPTQLLGALRCKEETSDVSG